MPARKKPVSVSVEDRFIEKIVESAPPLSSQQRSSLAAMLPARRAAR